MAAGNPRRGRFSTEISLKPRSRENIAVNARQTRQTCTEAVTKYRNYNANETDEEREHPLQTLRDNAANRIRSETDA